MTFEVRRLRASDLTKAFRCGHHGLDNFLRRHALTNQSRGLSATWVCVVGLEVAGFVTVAATSVKPTEIEPHALDLPPYPAPALLLARMGTALKYQKQGVGDLLLRAVYETACVQAKHVGCVGVLVDAKPGAVNFYARKHFSVVQEPADAESATVMFRPMVDVRAELTPSSE
ncbi:MAG: GNAT family N-acetyltransferase [Myxococcales bacterium]|nr:GNAT family N-acetyltransferase [Myxococcales bacterium]